MFPKSWRQHQLQGRLAISHLYWTCTPCSQELCQSMSVYMHQSVLMLPFNSPRQRQWVCTDSSHYSHTSDEKRTARPVLYLPRNTCGTFSLRYEWKGASPGEELSSNTAAIRSHLINVIPASYWSSARILSDCTLLHNTWRQHSEEKLTPCWKTVQTNYLFNTAV